MRNDEFLAQTLAARLLAGPWQRDGLCAGARHVFGGVTVPDQTKLVDSLLDRHGGAYPPSPLWLAGFLRQNVHFQRAAAVLARSAVYQHATLESALFAPAPRFADLEVPRIATVGGLAAWLGVTAAELDWLADARRQAAHTAIPILQHYRYCFADKRQGPPRLIEAPKPRLMALQRRILHEILDQVPGHNAAHGFVRSRSVLSAASPHAGEDVVVTVDLADFFVTTPLRRVHGLFRSLGYPWAVARALTGLCSTSTPAAVFRDGRGAFRHDAWTASLHGSRHLPQGAPTSPALANLAAFGLDVRLSGLSRALRGRYTRYADDMAFSGGVDLGRKSKALLAAVSAIAIDEGYAVRVRKTRIRSRARAQHYLGLTLNQHINVPRADYDLLKATLTNCVRRGPTGENRDGHADFRAHLDGRVGWVERVNPARGAKLRRVFDRIDWR